jgi:glucose-6-phosphate 1-dehydrogenase
VDNIRACWTDNEITPQPYPAGSWGPTSAIALAAKDSVTWHE